MFFQGLSVPALAALTFLTSAPLSAATPHRSPLSNEINKRSVAGSVSVQTTELKELSSQSHDFQEWMNTWFDQSTKKNAASSIPKLKEELQPFDSFMTNWLHSVIDSAAAAPSPSSQARSHQRRAASGSTEVPMGELQMLQSEYSSFHGWMDSWLGYANADDFEFTCALLKQEIMALEGWIDAFLAAEYPAASGMLSLPPTTASATFASGSGAPSTVPSGVSLSAAPYPLTTAARSIASGFLTSGVPSGYSAPAPSGYGSPDLSSASASASVPNYPAPSGYGSPALSASASASASAPSSPAASGSSGKGNLAVYYGQTFPDKLVSLSDMCKDDSVEIVILAFVSKFIGAGGYPEVDFTQACNGGPSSEMSGKQATGLKSCPDIASGIKTCQGMGKKVLLSLGGETATTSFTSDQEAASFANKLYDLFGAGTGESKGMRPFGDSQVDGFDIDWEQNGKTACWDTFVQTLRSKMGQKGLISAAPQCPTLPPSQLAALDMKTLQALDYVFVQNYNNGKCNVGGSDFVSSFKSWSSALPKAKIYVGAPGCEKCAGSGYLPPDQLAANVKKVISQGASNFGGVMLWDGPAAKANGNFLSTIKSCMG